LIDYADIVRVYQGSDGEATRALYRELEQSGPIGAIGVNLFRACKCSERAKLYRRGRGYKTAAYDRKDWSIRNLAEALNSIIGSETIFRQWWGWAIDDALRGRGDPHHHILYVDLPTGQVSFHTGARGPGPDYPGQWDGVQGAAAERICRWVAIIMARASSMPYGDGAQPTARAVEGP
jgi:hypothetical protein